MTPSASRLTLDPTTLQIATLFDPQSFACRSAPSVSAVSPDWEIATVSVEHEDVTRVLEPRRDVRGEEESVRADPDDQRRAAVLHAQELSRRPRADDAERVGAVEHGRRMTRR